MTSSILLPRPPFVYSRTVRIFLTSTSNQVNRVSCEMALTFVSELAVVKILHP